MQPVWEGITLVKYTLYCKRAQLFRPGPHYLQFGIWYSWTPDQVILQHGYLSDEEYNRFSRQTLINVFQDSRYGTVSIIDPYSEKYMNRVKKVNSLTQYIGCLHMELPGYYIGEVHVK